MMNITIAIIYVNGVARSTVEDDCLVACTAEGGRDIDVVRLRLTEAFTEIHGTNDIEVLFPELGECT
jgi:hypothetical protein